MGTERKRTLKPVTLLKVKKFIQSAIGLIDNEVEYSLVSLAREHGLDGKMGTSLLELGFIEGGENGKYKFTDKNLSASREISVQLMENVRLYKIQKATNKILSEQNQISQSISPVKIDLASIKNDSNTKDDTLDEINLKSLKKPEIQSMLERALNSVQQSKQSDIFDGINNTYKERFELAKSIASGVYSKFATIEFEPDHHIESINNRIIFAAADLHEKLISYKKPTKNE